MCCRNILKMNRTGLLIMALGTCLIFDYLIMLGCTFNILHSIICRWCFAEPKADFKWIIWWNEVGELNNVQTKIRALRHHIIITTMRLDVISKDMEYCLNLKIPISSCRKEACRVIFLNSWLPSGCFFLGFSMWRITWARRENFKYRYFLARARFVDPRMRLRSKKKFNINFQH